MAQDSLTQRLMRGILPAPPPPPREGRVRLPDHIPNQPLRARVLSKGLEALMGALGLEDPLGERATPATGVGAVLGMLGPAAVMGGIKNVGRGLYSRLDDAVQLIPKGGTHPNKVLGLLKNNASGEELAYRGVPEWLASQGDTRVTPEALQAHLTARPAPMPEKKYVYPTTGGADDPSYALYQVPGGENYKATLSVMPQAPVSDEELTKWYVNRFGEKPGPYTLDPTKAEGQRTRRAFAETQGRRYTNSHFPDTPNVLVHTRSNQRTLPTGERGTLVENVQSDWHQAGRKQGYRGQDALSEAETAQLLQWRAVANDKGLRGLGEHAAPYQALEERLRQLEISKNTQVPDAPFKDSWPALGLKQEVLDAVANDADWIGITPASILNQRGEAISEAFQDQRLPLTLEKILQGFGGGKVERGPVVTEGITSDRFNQRLYLGPDGPAVGIAKRFTTEPVASVLPRVSEKDWAQIPAGKTRDMWQRAVTEEVEKNTQLLMRALEDQSRRPNTVEAFLARLTPEMREQIKKKGLPLLMAMLAAQYGSTPPPTASGR